MNQFLNKSLESLSKAYQLLLICQSAFRANFEGWRTPEAQRSKGPCVEITILLRQYAKEHKLYLCHHADRKANSTPESSGLSAWNAPWLICRIWSRADTPLQIDSTFANNSKCIPK